MNSLQFYFIFNPNLEKIKMHENTIFPSTVKHNRITN